MSNILLLDDNDNYHKHAAFKRYTTAYGFQLQSRQFWQFWRPSCAAE